MSPTSPVAVHTCSPKAPAPSYLGAYRDRHGTLLLIWTATLAFIAEDHGGSQALLRSTSFLVIVSGLFLSCIICTMASKSSSLIFWRLSASLSMSICRVASSASPESEHKTTGLTPLSGRLFFLALSAPLTPFASPGTGPDSFNTAIKAGLGFLNV